ncbi:hypothetical protein NDU88_005545 [Pleurodeles waltl]|uniref:Uncharacterized protein n=1 Tax=Pleurodeles waltl TaxID=8319 RepID=A0AAV7QLA1_PLEWA|nr:hypothetical protein NDU88_005545 [Pleurodeles waltl]
MAEFNVFRRQGSFRSPQGGRSRVLPASPLRSQLLHSGSPGLAPPWGRGSQERGHSRLPGGPLDRPRTPGGSRVALQVQATPSSVLPQRHQGPARASHRSSTPIRSTLTGAHSPDGLRRLAGSFCLSSCCSLFGDPVRKPRGRRASGPVHLRPQPQPSQGASCLGPRFVFSLWLCRGSGRGRGSGSRGKAYLKVSQPT